jgi:hypothetical protein
LRANSVIPAQAGIQEIQMILDAPVEEWLIFHGAGMTPGRSPTSLTNF